MEIKVKEDTMLRYNKIGNIKIGSVVKGLPKIHDKILLTKSSKAGGENFEPYNDECKKGFERIKVRLPFAEKSAITNTFDTKPTSFVFINGLKYYIKEIDGMRFAFPLQSNPANRDIDLPIIALSEKSIAHITLEKKAMLSLFVMNDDNTDFLDGRMGVFQFKTESLNSLHDIGNTLNTAVLSIPTTILKMANFTLEIYTKASANDSETGEVTYVRLLPPSLKDLVDAERFVKENPSTVEYLLEMERAIKANQDKERSKAIDEQSACLFFDVESLIIEPDLSEIEKDSVSVPESVKEEKKTAKKTAVKKSSASKKANEGLLDLDFEDNTEAKVEVKAPSKAKSSNKTTAEVMKASAKETKESDVKAQAEHLASIYPGIQVKVIESAVNNFGVAETELMLKEANGNLTTMVKLISEKMRMD